MPYKYFLYSSTYVKERMAIDKKMGKEFECGTVVVNGTKKEYSNLSNKPTLANYSDVRIIAEGVTEMMRYTKPSS